MNQKKIGQFKKNQLTLAVFAGLFSTVALADPATDTIRNIDDLTNANGAITTTDKIAIAVQDQKDFRYDGNVDIMIDYANGSSTVNRGISAFNANVQLGQTTLKIISTDSAASKLYGLYVFDGAKNQDSYNGGNITIGDDSIITIENYSSTQEQAITGISVWGNGQAVGESDEDFAKRKLTANIGNLSTIYLVNGSGGTSIGVNAYQENATITLGGNTDIIVTSKGHAFGILADGVGGSSKGGTVTAKDNLSLHISSDEGIAKGIDARDNAEVTIDQNLMIDVSGTQGSYGISAASGSTVTFTGAKISAHSPDGLGTAIQAMGNSKVIGHTGEYNIQGDITSDNSLVDFSANGNSVFVGSMNTSNKGTINLELADDATWGLTADSQITTLKFSGSGGDKSVHFGAGSGNFQRLTIDSLEGTGGTFYMNSSIADKQGDYIYIKRGAGEHALVVHDSGVDIATPWNQSLDMITDQSSGANFTLDSMDLSNVNINAIDGGTYEYSLYKKINAQGHAIWYLAVKPEAPLTPIDPNNPLNPFSPFAPKLKTTPATDAVISMATAPKLIMADVMDNLRFRKGSLKNNAGDGYGAWGRFIGNKTEVDKGRAQFDLKQTGVEIGVDKTVSTQRGQVLIGVQGNYVNADLEHQRRGESKLKTYGVGVSATYFDDSGIYVDGVLQYNRFDNDLRAVSTQGMSVRGDYSQNAIAASVEVGYDWQLKNNLWVEPYAKMTYMKISGEEVLLNTGMVAKIGSQDSFRGELGVSAGKDFILKNQTVVSPYAKVAWSHEFKNNDSVTLNHYNQFSSNLPEDYGRVGIGVNLQAKEKFSFFGEVDYRKGSGIKSPIQANVGLRVNF